MPSPPSPSSRGPSWHYRSLGGGSAMAGVAHGSVGGPTSIAAERRGFDSRADGTGTSSYWVLVRSRLGAPAAEGSLSERGRATRLGRGRVSCDRWISGGHRQSAG